LEFLDTSLLDVYVERWNHCKEIPKAPRAIDYLKIRTCHFKELNVQVESDLLLVQNLEECAQLSIDDLLSRLGTSQSGLTSEAVDDHFKEFGPNVLARKKQRFVLFEFFSHFKSPLVLILLFAGTIAGVFGDVASTTIIFSIIILSISLDFYQEKKAEKAAEILKEKVSTTATVFRNNVKEEIRLADIVPGDIFYLAAGDIVPADARVIESKDLFIDQSTLTGESYPMQKTASVPKEKKELVTEWNNCLFMGTPVVSGTASAVVVNTGSFTEFGKIAKNLSAREIETEFDVSSRKLGVLILEVTLVLVIFIFFFLALLQRDILQSFLFSIALAVGLTPELLPMIITINLSKGAMSMAKSGVIVKKLSAIQNFGNMDVLCTDKTGTLTENKITLVKHVDYEGNENDGVLGYSYINSYYQTGLKSPLDFAILEHENFGIAAFQKVDEIPFDFNRKRVSIIAEHEGLHIIISKGAPEEIIKICSHCEANETIVEMRRELRQTIQKKFNDLSADGFRVLAVSYKMQPMDPSHQYKIEDEAGMVFLGFVVFLDPPKATAKESLASLKETGIEVKIVTGDNELVARKVCEQLEFQIRGVLLGSQILYMTDDALQRAVERTNIFARVTPGQKSRILNALKKNGHVVGFLGDGINDATSIKNADVGISVDNAVDVAKEAADIILLENKLGVLHSGVIEGRKTFRNTLKYLLMGTSSNFGNMFSMSIASIFLPFLPMLPLQILLNNLLYDLSETAIPTDNVDEDALSHPSKLDISYVRRFMTIVGPISSIFDILTFVFMIFVIIGYVPAVSDTNAVALFQTAWFIESLSTQTLVIFVLRTNKSPFFKSKPAKPLIISSFAVVIFAIMIQFTPIGGIFEFVNPFLNISNFNKFIEVLLFVAVVVVVYLILVEFVKKRFHKKYGNLLDQHYRPLVPNIQRKRK